LNSVAVNSKILLKLFRVQIYSVSNCLKFLLTLTWLKSRGGGFSSTGTLSSLVAPMGGGGN